MFRDLIGVKFLDHGRSKEGLDCYGLVIEVYKRIGINLPDVEYKATDIETSRNVDKQLRELIPMDKIEQPIKNCIVELAVLGDPSHVGIYLGKGDFLHTNRKNGVVIEKLQRWENRISAFYKVREKGQQL
jgi:hypothetical protein